MRAVLGRHFVATYHRAMQGMLKRIEADDVDRLASGQDGFELHYEQLSAGAYRGCVRLIELPGVRLVHESGNRGVRQRGSLGRDCYGFALPLVLPGLARFGGQPVGPDSIMLGRGDGLDLALPAGAEFIALVAERALLEPLWLQMYGKPLAAWLDHQLVVPAAPAPAAAVRSMHRVFFERVESRTALLDDAATTIRLRDALLAEWLEAIPPAVDATPAATVAERRAVVERACELMLARPDDPPTLISMCSRLGISARKLGYCFNDTLGTSPARYLRALRLNAARRALCRAAAAGAPGEGVQDIASRFGFWHFGQFALDYRRQFGERPSQTLRRSVE